jgi:hypothetical protein
MAQKLRLFPALVQLGDRMKILSEQKSRALAEKNGWSLEFAQGFLKGQYSRQCGARLSTYGTVGLDDYCLGFRAGYFERQNTAARRVETSAAQNLSTQNVRPGAVAASSVVTTLKQGLGY